MKPASRIRFAKAAAMFTFAAFAVPQAMACFTVYNTSNQVVYSGINPPIDMSYQIHQRLPSAFPGGHMVFGMDTDCPAIDTRYTVGSGSSYQTASVTPRGTRPARADRN